MSVPNHKGFYTRCHALRHIRGDTPLKGKGGSYPIGVVPPFGWRPLRSYRALTGEIRTWAFEEWARGSSSCACIELYLAQNHVTSAHNQESAINPLRNPISYSILHVCSITPKQFVDDNLLRKLDLVKYGKAMYELCITLNCMRKLHRCQGTPAISGPKLLLGHWVLW